MYGICAGDPRPKIERPDVSEFVTQSLYSVAARGASEPEKSPKSWPTAPKPLICACDFEPTGEAHGRFALAGSGVGCDTPGLSLSPFITVLPKPLPVWQYVIWSAPWFCEYVLTK